MRLNLKVHTPEGFMVPKEVSSWYDRSTQSWVCMLLDKYGNQVGEAIYSGNRVSHAAAMRSLSAKLKGE